MIPVLSFSLVVLSLAAAAVASVLASIDRPAGRSYFTLLVAIESLLLLQVVIGFVKLATGDRPTQPWVFAGYLLGALVILPVGVLWSLAERSKWGTAVLVLAGLVLAVVVIRMNQVWLADV